MRPHDDLYSGFSSSELYYIKIDFEAKKKKKMKNMKKRNRKKKTKSKKKNNTVRVL